MKNNQKVLLVSIGLVALGIYLFFKKTPQPTEEKTDFGQTTPTAKADYDKVLKKGSKGVEVGILQRALKQLVDDEDFGALTEARLKNVTGLTQITLNQYNTIIENKSKNKAKK
jgi:hypothetical protein